MCWIRVSIENEGDTPRVGVRVVVDGGVSCTVSVDVTDPSLTYA